MDKVLMKKIVQKSIGLEVAGQMTYTVSNPSLLPLQKEMKLKVDFLIIYSDRCICC